MDKIIAPSILSADFANLSRDVRMVNDSAAGWFHLDVMDGVFVPNISFGIPVVRAIAREARKPMDAHLMIVHPEKYVSRFAALGCSWISVHIESCEDLRGTLSLIRESGAGAGIAINPETDAAALEPFLHDADFILVMGVHPGFSGQKFIESTTAKVAQVSGMIARSGSKCFIEVDGGVSPATIGALSEAGASVFVAGSAAFPSTDPKECSAAIARLASLVQVAP